MSRRASFDRMQAHGLVGAALGCFLLAISVARAGHEITYYPSFYPQEIRVELLAPEAAAKEFLNTADPLQAYIGAAPRFAGKVPAHVKSVESLRSFIVLDINPQSRFAQNRDTRCQAVERIIANLGKQSDVVVHPYPVTPYHADYLNHVDRTLDRKPAAQPAGETGAPPTLWRRSSGIAELVPVDPTEIRSDWDASVDEVAVSDLMRKAGFGFNAWPAPPWMKDGWFQAYHLLHSAVGDPADAKRADEIFDRLVHAEVRDLTERINLERALLTALTRGCERAVIGYRVRNEFYHDDFTGGAENILVDSQLGFNTPMFFRVIKLKDFPWNGWLRVGTDATPTAAWNPIAGFDDTVGRLVWSAVGDDAFLPIPYNSAWVANRAEVRDDPDAKLGLSIRVPADAIMPQPGTGRLAAIGAPRGAAIKLFYRVSASPFIDGTKMETADLLYPYALAFRWGEKEANGAAFDPEIATATQLMRERLRGVRIIGEEKSTITQGDKTFEYRSPIVEVYLDEFSAEAQVQALLAPPWSSVPWHVLALMEAAVERGVAAFSKTEAERRNLPWLDLVRDAAQREKLAALVKEFAAASYRPAALESLVSAEAAKARWQALDRFIAEHGHLLVTNGPYRLRSWSPKEIVFDVIRDYSYPVGLGTFNPFAYPPRALITAIQQAGRRIVIATDVEFAVKAQRDRRMERVQLTRETIRETYPITALPRYVVVGADGNVAAAGTARWEPNGLFTVSLPPALTPGKYAFFTGIFLDGNTTDPDIGRIEVQSE